MSLNSEHYLIHKAHTDYTDLLQTDSLFDNTKVNRDLIEYRRRYIDGARHGKLVAENRFFNDIQNNQSFWLAHITRSTTKMKETGGILQSGGCLVGSIYAVPAYENSDGTLSMHNLGQYLYSREAPLLSKGTRVNPDDESDHSNIDVLFIKVELKNLLERDTIHRGIDYLCLGRLHYHVYEDLKYLLIKKERDQLEDTVVQRIRATETFLKKTNTMYWHDVTEDNDTFFAEFSQATKHLSILGYLYFEALCEYSMMWQDSPAAQHFAEKGELYNEHYKELMFTLKPEMAKGFKLSDFCPDINKVCDFFANGVISDLDTKRFKTDLQRRLIFFINRYLFDGADITTLDLEHNTRVYFDPGVKPLIGHLLHRELRNYHRFPDFYFYFDQVKALKVWNYWNRENILVPFNGLMPKGEIGLNPAMMHMLDYKVYNSRLTETDPYNLRFIRNEQLDVEFRTRLVDLSYTLMRDKTNASNSD